MYPLLLKIVGNKPKRKQLFILSFLKSTFPTIIYFLFLFL